MSGVDWGTVPSWISAVGSLAAFGTAIWAARAAWRQVKYSADQQRHRDERAEQEQAAKVAAWIGIEKSNEGRPLVYLRYINKSGLPVYDLNVKPMGYPDSGFMINLVEPGEEVRTQYLERLTQVINERYDGQVRSLFQAFKDFDDPMSKAKDVASSNAPLALNFVEFSFRDTQNLRWRRDSKGMLTKVRVDADGDNIDDPNYYANKSIRQQIPNWDKYETYFRGFTRG